MDNASLRRIMINCENSSELLLQSKFEYCYII